ncbi:MAG TPA: hypothetical protein VMF64_07005 [Steroidobacteraceae bacterium]|nr:hypothetical protein [Steroidobacteraceae bacterium]
MNTLRAGQPGATRLCPHCKATVLESASICPGCRHHLRFSGGKQLAEQAFTALSVDGTIAHRQAAEPCEYCIVLDISNERGEQVMRQVVGVGALQPGELRRLNLSVQMLPLVAQSPPRTATAPTATAAAPPALAARPNVGRPAAAAAPNVSAQPSGQPARAPAVAAPSASRPVTAPAVGGAAPATPGGARPSTPSPSPGSAAPGAAAGPASGPPAGAASAPRLPPQPPEPSQSQRLRIFRKP